MKSLNRILNNDDRWEYDLLYKDYFWEHCPEIMARKFPLANVQQFFVYDTVKQFRKFWDDFENWKLLSAGCFEDTAYEMLKREFKGLIGIDPTLNVDLHTYTQIQYKNLFDIIFATSVLEHVPNDEEFVEDICKLLKPEGYGILTMDFKRDYKVGDRLPYTDVRFYTVDDMHRLRIICAQNGCNLVDNHSWGVGEADFEYDGCRYSFGTFVFQKGRGV